MLPKKPIVIVRTGFSFSLEGVENTEGLSEELLTIFKDTSSTGNNVEVVIKDGRVEVSFDYWWEAFGPGFQLPTKLAMEKIQSRLLTEKDQKGGRENARLS